MILTGTTALIALIISILLLIILLAVNLKTKKKKQVNWCFISIVLCLLICCFGQILSIICPEVLGIEPVYFDYIVYIGTCFLPVAFLFFSLTFAKTKIKFKKKYLLLFIIPIISLLVLWTNDFHHLFYVKYGILNSTTEFGPYFPVHSLYTYILIIISIFYLIKFSIKNSGFFSKQSIAFILGVLIPVAVNIIGMFGIEMSIYITPISFTITVLFFALAILKFDFLNVTPIALQTVVDKMSDGYIVLDDNNTIIDFNKTFLNMFNIDTTKIRGKDLFSLLRDSKIINIDSDILKKHINKAKSTDKTSSFNLSLEEKNKFFSVEVSSLISNGSFLGMLVLIKDVTQHNLDMQQIKNNQDMLMERERLASLGQLIGGIAHNLKTPIMSIAGAAEGLNDLIKEYDSSIDDPEVNSSDHHEIASDMSSWIEKIKTHTEYMSDIITAVKGQAVSLSNEYEVDFTIGEVLKRVDILMKHELKNALIYLNIKLLTDENIQIEGDVNSLVQVINNMISNSIQSYNGEPNKNIDMIVTKENNNLIISIQDYGSGIPKKVKDKLFKEMITTKGKNGTGLGLYMSYSTIKAHFNGDIKMESEEGKGTLLKIIIPVK